MSPPIDHTKEVKKMTTNTTEISKLAFYRMVKAAFKAHYIAERETTRDLILSSFDESYHERVNTEIDTAIRCGEFMNTSRGTLKHI